MAHAFDLQDQIAVVTGASSGIGRATALALADRGCHVLVHAGRREAAAQATCRLVQQRLRQSHVLLADLADSSARDQFVDAAWNWQGRIDVWINNAGADVLTGSWRHAAFDDKLNALWQVDVVGTISLTRAVAERMRARARGNRDASSIWDGTRRPQEWKQTVASCLPPRKARSWPLPGPRPRPTLHRYVSCVSHQGGSERPGVTPHRMPGSSEPAVTRCWLVGVAPKTSPT